MSPFQVSLQAERLARQAELRRRDLQLLRAERQRRLCEDIISTQRRIIEGKVDFISQPLGRVLIICCILEGKVDLPEDLRELYALYQQEIHASTYTSGLYTASRDFYDSKLPPINLKEFG